MEVASPPQTTNGFIEYCFSDNKGEHIHELRPLTTQELPYMNLATILAATSNFAVENKLGEGGFGPVYKVINYTNCFSYH